ncbi:hypothetical protein, partial [Vibrio vulnificus]|uniref:hypothetical protein n=1 Tax=Vibrio vulnificus TaxID=672 RepID=UPI001F513C83
MALGNVINALGDDKKWEKGHVPHRDSKLTRLLHVLQQCLIFCFLSCSKHKNNFCILLLFTFIDFVILFVG